MQRLQLPGDAIGARRGCVGGVAAKTASTKSSTASASAAASSALTSSSLGDLLSSVSAIEFKFPTFASSAAAAASSSSAAAVAAAFVPVSALDDARQAASKKPANSKANRKKLVTSEIAQFSAVLAHPSFQSNALAAVREHLQNAQAASEQKTHAHVEFGKTVVRTLKAAHKAQAANAHTTKGGASSSSRTAAASMQM